jgi:hypothetical protein
MMMQGMAFGGGSAVAHRVVDSVAGPRTMQIEHMNENPVMPSANAYNSVDSAKSTPTNVAASTPNTQCGEEIKSFLECMNDNGQDVSKCRFAFDILSQCQQVSKENARWS